MAQRQRCSLVRGSTWVCWETIQKGMKKDDHFTLAIGGMVTILNNSSGATNRGDLVEWTFLEDTSAPTKTEKAGPRRIQVRKCGLWRQPVPKNWKSHGECSAQRTV